MVKIRHNLKADQGRKQSCKDKGRTHKEFKVGDHVFLKVKSRCSSRKLGKHSKLAVHYCGLFEILERIGLVHIFLHFLHPCVFIIFSMCHLLKSMYLFLIILLIGM
jgi:hypothetical protein